MLLKPKTRWLTFLAIFVLALIVAPSLASACPTCKDGISENQGGMVRGYQMSIIFMMSMPFLILGGLSTYFYFEVRKARARQALTANLPAIAENP